MSMQPQATYESLLDNALSNAHGLLETLGKDELNDILSDDSNSKLDGIIQDLPQMKSLITEREMLLAQNKSLAEWNLSQEPKLREAKQRLIDTYETTSTVKSEVDQLKQQLDELSQKRSLDTTLALLQAAAQEAEDESEKVAEQFVKGEIAVDQFLDEFLPKRCLAHSRKIKSEKMSEVLRSQQLPPRSHSSGALAAHKRPAPPPPPVPPHSAQPMPGYWNYGPPTGQYPGM